MKECKKCGIIKEIELFYKKCNSCKSCEIERTKEYIRKNKEKVSQKNKQRYLENREENLAKKRLYDDKNREKVREKARNRYDRDAAKEYYKKNKDKILKRNKEWSDSNKEIHRKMNKTNVKKWMKLHPHVVVWRQILYRTIKKFNKIKEESTIELLGYSAEDLKSHIQSLFKEGMSWENWGEWHIDHIKPLSSFDKDAPISEVNSLENLRPLWANENLSRPKKY
jgi:hypothetical protein